MPWELVELPYRDGSKTYVRYPNGITEVATEEHLAIWNYVKDLEAQLDAMGSQSKKSGRK